MDVASRPRRLRIALVCPEIPDYALDFAEVAAGRNHVDLFIADRLLEENLPPSSPDIALHRVQFPRQRQIISGIPPIVHLAREIRRTKPDLVHILADGNAWCVPLRALLWPLPVVITVHDADYHPGDAASQRVPRSVINMLRKSATAILVHGPDIESRLAAQLPETRKRIFQFPHIPLLRFRNSARVEARAEPDDRRVRRVLFFGRIAGYKGLKYFLDAALRISATTDDVRFVLAGSGSLDPYREQLDRLGNHVDVINKFITFEEAAGLFAQADILALPYVEASQSGVLMMAVPYALPVVASDVGELSATVRDVNCGLLVPPKDSVALADAITKLLSDDALYSQTQASEKAAMETVFSMPTLSGNLGNIYAQILKDRHAHDPGTPAQ